MKAADHQCRVFATPWPGVHGTRIQSARHYGRHWHATYGIGLLEDGAQRSASGRGVVDAYAGDLITTNPGEVHDGRPLGAPARRWRIVYLEPAAWLTAGDLTRGDVELTRPVIHDAALRNALQCLFGRLDAWSAQRDAAARLACDEALVQFCARLLECHTTAAPRERVHGDVAGARDRLAAEGEPMPSLAELAAGAGLSKYQLLRRFQKAYGVPPHAWLLQQRAERARALIRRGSSLAEAAASAGFADQSHMTRVFTRQFGFSPGAWRLAMQRAG